ncbi:MAG: hypothetical protein ABT08_08980 [Microbacterium sp. SCN 71-21]|uniref:hypothetical protein n=1 Tax=Microbacterium sp. SCN 71-21 TaxID=1660116 RepID=UPI00086E9F3C|nr:hypothetical protein [Microbacterium sp. SCN 71-21]ODU76559.1 MAG: hypothetical protein ABT08_08980 [Microbacterium sp. SCN 71-21]
MSNPGPYEQRLIQLAQVGDWSQANLPQLQSLLPDLATVLRAASDDNGLTGQAALAASETLRTSATAIDQLTAAIGVFQAAITQANAERESARSALAALPNGSLDGTQEALVRGAATGLTLPLGPISVIAGPFAVDQINQWMSSQREAAAHKAVTAASSGIAASMSDQPRFPLLSADGFSRFTLDTAPDGTDTPATPPARTSTTHTANTVTAPPVPTAATVPGVTDHTVQTGDGSWTGGNDIVLTPDGPLGSGGTSFAPGTVIGSGAGTGLQGGASTLTPATPGGFGAGAGIAGAAMLGAGARYAGAGLTAAATADATPGAGAFAGGRGAGSSGGSGGLGADARSGSGGLLGGARSSAAGAATAAPTETSGTRSGAAGGMLGGGAPGSANGDGKRGGRGLGGPVAPKLEEDVDLGPRSEGAGAGGRA